MQKKQVIIIGGGAAGFFTAANLDENKYHVTILEQNSNVLQKVKISGGGRCNVSHACFDPMELVRFYPRGNKELISVFSKFQPGDTMAWFEERNVALKIEKDQRLFPESNSSQTIIDAFLKEVEKKKFDIRPKTTVKAILKEENNYRIETNQTHYHADIIVFTTGSSPKSLNILKTLGHRIVDGVPSLFTFNIKDPLLEGLSGTSFEHAEINLPQFKAEESGPLLITHWGLSGPAILKLSAWQALNLAAVNYRFEIEVNFISQTEAQAEALWEDYREKHPKKTIGQAKIYSLTNRFWNKLLEISGVNPNKPLAQIDKKEKQSLLKNLCRKRFTVTGKSTFKEEFVTAGGVELKEINFKTMASKILDNFYIAGEVLNIDAVTGGFNFQACWSEAWLIAQDLNGKTEN